MWLHLKSLLLTVVFPALLVGVLYWPGRQILRLVTNGRYPPEGKAHNVELVALVALAVLLICLAVYYS